MSLFSLFFVIICLDFFTICKPICFHACRVFLCVCVYISSCVSFLCEINFYDFVIFFSTSNKIGGAQIRLSSGAGGALGEIDDGDYATLRGPLMSDHQLRLDDYGILPMSSNDHADDTGSEEGKLLACVRDDSVTYASTRDLLPPTCRELSPEYITSPNRMLSPNRMTPLGPVSVTVHSTEVHVS
jgi:hypothetical protein